MNLDTLCSQLNASTDELGALATLSDAELSKLSAQLADAKVLQHKHVSDAFNQAIDQLPRLMRKPIQKMFEGLI